MKFTHRHFNISTLQANAATDFGDNFNLVKNNLMDIKPFVKHGREEQLESDYSPFVFFLGGGTGLTSQIVVAEFGRHDPLPRCLHRQEQVYASFYDIDSD